LIVGISCTIYVRKARFRLPGQDILWGDFPPFPGMIFCRVICIPCECPMLDHLWSLVIVPFHKAWTDLFLISGNSQNHIVISRDCHRMGSIQPALKWNCKPWKTENVVWKDEVEGERISCIDLNIFGKLSQSSLVGNCSIGPNRELRLL